MNKLLILLSMFVSSISYAHMDVPYSCSSDTFSVRIEMTFSNARAVFKNKYGTVVERFIGSRDGGKYWSQLNPDNNVLVTSFFATNKWFMLVGHNVSKEPGSKFTAHISTEISDPTEPHSYQVLPEKLLKLIKSSSSPVFDCIVE